MPWESTSSASFRARHDSRDAEDARRVLQSLEHVRVQLEELFGRVPPRITVVLHDRPWALALSNPFVGALRLATAPSGRPLVAGWTSREELHLLSPATFTGRSAPATPGLREMGRLTAAALYARRVIVEASPGLRHGIGALPVARAIRELRWAWLLEGGSRWLSGQSAHAGAAVAARLRDGGRPSFPPGLRDAPLLGPTLIELLADAEGEQAVVGLCERLGRGGPREVLERAFGARLVSIEGEWRAYLAELAGRNR